MVYISTDGASLIFEFDDAQHYLWDGTMNVPLNALTVVFDESDMVTFRKANDDILLSANINEFDGFDKDSLKAWLQSNAYGTAVKDGMSLKVVDELPAVGSEKFIYLKEAADHSGYEMWVYTSETGWVMTSSLNASTYQGKDALKIEKINTGDTATTVYWKIKSTDKFLIQDNSGATADIDIKYEKEPSGDYDESGNTIYNHFLRLYGKNHITPVKEIDINELYRDNYLVDVDYDDDKQELILTFKIDNHYQKVKVPIPTLYEGKEAIDVYKLSGDSAFTVSLVIDPESNSAITQSDDGLYLDVKNDVRIYSASTFPAETRAIWKEFDELHLISGETISSTTYTLVSLGEEKEEIIEVPNDQYVSAITIDDENQQILLDLVKADGTLEQLSGNAETIIFEDDAKDGLEIDNHLLKVKIDETSDSGLTVSSGGVKMNADETINSASTNAIENKEVWRNFDEIHIISSETISSTTYVLNVMDEDKDVVIEIENQEKVSAITVDDENQQILLDLVKSDGTLEQLSGDATSILFEDDVNDGLEVVSGYVKVKLVDDEKVLTVDSGGVESHISLSAETSLENGIIDHTLHLQGIDEAEIASATTFIKEGDNINLSLTDGNTIEISGKNYTIITSLTGTGKADTLYLLREVNETTSAITYSQYAWINSAWKQISAKGISIIEMTQAEYDALAVKDPDTIYIITDAAGFIIYVNALPTSGQTEDALYLLRKNYALGGTYDEPYTYSEDSDAFIPIDIDLSDMILDAGTY